MSEIPFEIHLTTDHLNSDRRLEFVDFCLAQEGKPLMIELSKGDFTDQPMLSKVIYSDNFEKVLAIATELSTSMSSRQFSVKRLKIEIPADEYLQMKDYPSDFKKYFEWHCKIEIMHPEKVLQLCERHKVHLSLNSLRNEPDKKFITLREFGDQSIFRERIRTLAHELNDGGWTIIKQQSEYCIYDNNNFLDHGWLPQ